MNFLPLHKVTFEICVSSPVARCLTQGEFHGPESTKFKENLTRNAKTLCEHISTSFHDLAPPQYELPCARFDRGTVSLEFAVQFGMRVWKTILSMLYITTWYACYKMSEEKNDCHEFHAIDQQTNIVSHLLSRASIQKQVSFCRTREWFRSRIHSLLYHSTP